MAQNARKKLTSLEDLDGAAEEQVETPETVADEAEVQEMKKIEEVLRAADVSGGTLRLERKGPGDFKWQFIGKLKVEDFNYDQIMAVYGGGDYRAQTYKSNGSFYKKFEFSIDYRRKGSLDLTQVPLAEKPGEETTRQIVQQGNNRAMMDMFAQAQNQSSQQMLLMVTMMQESSKQQMTMLTGMFQSLAAAIGKEKSDPATAYMPLMLEMVKSHGGNKGGDGNSITDIIGAIRELNALAKGEPPPKEEKDEDMLDKVFKYGGPLLTAFLTKTPLQMPGVNPSAAIPQADPRVIDMPPVTPKPVDSKAASAELTQKINTYMELLISAAEKDSDPSAYAQMISDMLGDAHYQTLLQELSTPDWFAKLASGNPRIVACQAWFTELRQCLIDMNKPDEQPVTTQPDGGAASAAASQG